MTPAPHEFEQKVEFCARFCAHPSVTRIYASAIKRHVAAEKRWAKAKADSLVSISTKAGEMLLFGKL